LVPGGQSRSGSDTTRDERAVGLNASFRDQRCFGTQGLRLNFLIQQSIRGREVSQ